MFTHLLVFNYQLYSGSIPSQLHMYSGLKPWHLECWSNWALCVWVVSFFHKGFSVQNGLRWKNPQEDVFCSVKLEARALWNLSVNEFCYRALLPARCQALTFVCFEFEGLCKQREKHQKASKTKTTPIKEKAVEDAVGITPVDRINALKKSNQAVGWGVGLSEGIARLDRE